MIVVTAAGLPDLVLSPSFAADGNEPVVSHHGLALKVGSQNSP